MQPTFLSRVARVAATNVCLPNSHPCTSIHIFSFARWPFNWFSKAACKNRSDRIFLERGGACSRPSVFRDACLYHYVRRIKPEETWNHKLSVIVKSALILKGWMFQEDGLIADSNWKLNLNLNWKLNLNLLAGEAAAFAGACQPARKVKESEESLWKLIVILYQEELEFWKPGGELGVRTLKVVLVKWFSFMLPLTDICCDAKALSVLVLDSLSSGMCH